MIKKRLILSIAIIVLLVANLFLILSKQHTASHDSQRIIELYMKAIASKDSGRYAEAAAQFEEVLSEAGSFTDGIYVEGAYCFLGQLSAEQKNMGQALRWWSKAAQLGNNIAAFKLGEAYRVGDGLPQSPWHALRWYLVSADDRNSDAQSALGDLCLSGEAFTKDPIAACIWYGVAADCNHQNAIEKRDNLMKTLTPAEIEVVEKAIKAWHAAHPLII